LFPGETFVLRSLLSNTIPLHIVVDGNMSKQDTCVRDLLLLPYSGDQARCPVIPNGVSRLWTFSANVLFSHVFLVKFMNVKMSKPLSVFNERQKQRISVSKIRRYGPRYLCSPLMEDAEMLRLYSNQETQSSYSSRILKYFISRGSVGENECKCAAV
jgi:hypothetical protein